MSDATVTRWFSDEVVAGRFSLEESGGVDFWAGGWLESAMMMINFSPTAAGRGKAKAQRYLRTSMLPPQAMEASEVTCGLFMGVTFCTAADRCGHRIPLRRKVSSRYSTNTPRAQSLHSAVRRVILVYGYDAMEFMTMRLVCILQMVKL